MPDDLAVSAFSPLFKNKQPLLDVRAPAEFERGAFPVATNLPLLNDDERKAVSIRYREQGQSAAIALGEKLLTGDTRTERLALWSEYFDQNPGAALYCFRGGLRSKTVQLWLAAEGINAPLIRGGYKALRRFCLNVIEQASKADKFLVIGGKTGSAKTHLLKELKFALDLEGHANHRGSAFGRRSQEQPNQINFENQIAIDLNNIEFAKANKIFVEDESRAIGSLSIPHSLHRSMSNSPLAIIEEDFEFRVDTILNDYIHSNLKEYNALFPHSYRDIFADSLLSALLRIKRRLGVEPYTSIKLLMERALSEIDFAKSAELHRAWICKLLQDYYDPMYEYQLEKKSQLIVFRGSSSEFLDWSERIDKSI